MDRNARRRSLLIWVGVVLVGIAIFSSVSVSPQGFFASISGNGSEGDQPPENPPPGGPPMVRPPMLSPHEINAIWNNKEPPGQPIPGVTPCYNCQCICVGATELKEYYLDPECKHLAVATPKGTTPDCDEYENVPCIHPDEGGKFYMKTDIVKDRETGEVKSFKCVPAPDSSPAQFDCEGGLVCDAPASSPS